MAATCLRILASSSSAPSALAFLSRVDEARKGLRGDAEKCRALGKSVAAGLMGRVRREEDARSEGRRDMVRR